MFQKISQWIVRWPWLIILAFVGVTIFLGAQLPKTAIETSIKKQLPHDMASRLNIDKIEEIFGGSEMLIIVFSAPDILQKDTLKRVEKVSKKLERVKEFDKIISIFTIKEIEGHDGQMLVESAVNEIPQTKAERDTLQQRLADNDMINGIVVSKDFKHVAIVGLINAKTTDEIALAKIDEALKKYPGPEAVSIAGFPFVRAHLGEDIASDMRKFLPFGILLMLIFLFVAFRQIRGVLLPLLMTVMAIIAAMGIISVIGWKIQMITVILPVLLIAVANDYGIHLLARYQEDNKVGRDITPKELAQKGVVELGKPVIMTGITTIAGLLCLLTHIIIPVREMAVLASFGVAFALIGSIVFIPAILSLLPRAKPIIEEEESERHEHFFERLLRLNANMVIQKPKTVITVFLVCTLIIGSGIFLVIADTNPVNYYPEDAVVAKSMNLVNDVFGGSTAISIVAQGNMKSPKELKAIDELESWLKDLPEVDTTTSIAQVVKKMNRAMLNDADSDEYIPDSAEAIAQYFLLYSMSGDPDDFDRMVDFPYEHAQITARINSSSTSAIKGVVNKTKEYVANVEDSPFTLVGGFGDLFAELVDYVVRGQIISLALSMLLIGILVGILFKSVGAGLIATIPLGLAMILLFGVMGYSGVELNMVTAMLSSIMIGVGVDYTIHFLWRYRQERFAGLAPEQAVYVTLTTTGRGIVFNAMSVIIGFVILLISSFLPVKFFGILVTVCVSACLVGALVLLPAIALVLRPKFLEP